jgi:tetratricopeptide (TPR) repeat protein
MSRRLRAVAIGVLILVSLASSAAVQKRIDAETPANSAVSDSLWIPSGKILRRLSLGNEGLLADIYWTRAVQYYGGRRRDQITDFSLLSPLLEITTDLDPHLMVVYKFGAIFLSEPAPKGADQPEQAVRLIRKGIQANPDEWRLWHDLGFIYYWDLKDYSAAAAAYLEGSKNPKAQPWMKVMAAVIAQKGGNRETSKFLWREAYQSTEDPTIKENALEHLEGFRALDDIEELNKRVATYHEQTGRWPESLKDLVAQGVLRGVPADPEGFPYQIDQDHKVQLNPKTRVKVGEPSTASRN